MKVTNTIRLPLQLKEKDLQYPKWTSKVKHHYTLDFEMWYTERFGWCIPTLLISKARRGANVQDRTYGVTLTGEVVTIGKGPHVERTINVYVTDTNLKRLQPLIDLKAQGQGKAGDIRDRISTRRMNTMSRRASVQNTLFGW